MFVPRDMSERFFCAAACCKGSVSSHEVSQGSDTVRIFCDVLGGHTCFSTFASLARAIGNTASAVDLLCSWKLFVSTHGPRLVVAMMKRRI